MGIKKSEAKQLQKTVVTMAEILSQMTNETGKISEIATALTNRAQDNQKESQIKTAQEINEVMIELSTSLGIIGAALQKALKIK
ncbi:MAG: hypothetical protein Unbinned2250contig1000_41 [Prokaryotic dsDNA virus sp.]|nr:MAG: hypothetical protein Unbinned2250contig1000_41 [Prokaryotic dsDNA virus sp.]|tara:strand:- start:604 stop:855 length:252 start_codon:yes stop_codon:yes gene_type:complete